MQVKKAIDISKNIFTHYYLSFLIFSYEKNLWTKHIEKMCLVHRFFYFTFRLDIFKGNAVLLLYCDYTLIPI
jgi:hypothetical protein